MSQSERGEIFANGFQLQIEVSTGPVPRWNELVPDTIRSCCVG